MNQNHILDLAESMLRLWGNAKAFPLAHEYADDCIEQGDNDGRDKWDAVAADIARLTELCAPLPSQAARHIGQEAGYRFMIAKLWGDMAADKGEVWRGSDWNVS
jgi:hypothetical protein